MDEVDKRIAERLGDIEFDEFRNTLWAYDMRGGTRLIPRRVWAAMREKEAEGDNKLKILASAMKKVLPPLLLQEVIDHCGPLAAFLRDGFGIDTSTEEGQ